MQSLKVLHESSTPAIPAPSTLKAPVANSLSLANGSIYDDFNAFSSKKRSAERKEALTEPEQETKSIASPSNNKKRTKKDIAAALAMDTTE
jgi:hypothetical protein